VQELYTNSEQSVDKSKATSVYNQEPSEKGESTCTFPKIKYPPEAEFRTCQVYFTNQKEACDSAKEADPLNTCKYEFTGWQEFKQTKDDENNKLDYPYKHYTRTETSSIINAPLVNKCFKPFKYNSFPMDFEYKNNSLVNQDCDGKTGDTDHDTNLFNLTKYTSFNFLNSTDSQTNYNNMLESICSVKYEPISALKDKVFFKFVLNPNKTLNTIKKLTINETQTGFTEDTSFNASQFTASSAYGLAYDTSQPGKNFRVFSVTSFDPKTVSVYKFVYNYLCSDKQIMSFERMSAKLLIDRLVDIQSDKYAYTKIDLKGLSLNLDNYKSIANIDKKPLIMQDLENIITSEKNRINKNYDDKISEQQGIIDNETTKLEEGRTRYSTHTASFENITDTPAFNIKKGAIINKREIDTKNIDIYLEKVIKKQSGIAILPTKINDTQYYYELTEPGVEYQITVPNETVCDVLVVGGGGGGGMDMGGGGGGGGVIYKTNYSISGTISAIVGNGGKGAPGGGSAGQPSGHQFTISATNGGDTNFGNLIAKGGGYGGSSYFQYTPNYGYGGSGASGGGASGYSDGNTGRGGTGTAGQGFNGGGNSGQYYAGGGGGAGEAGGSGRSNGAAKGGNGILCDILGKSYYWGGGGGGASYTVSGGNGGLGGGGGGAVGTTTGGTGYKNGNPGAGGCTGCWANTPGGDAGANTGGGGGGGAHYNANNRGGNGGSGIVVIRFTMNSDVVINSIYKNLQFYTNTENLKCWYIMDSSDNMLLDSSGKNNNLINNNAVFDSVTYMKGKGSIKLNSSQYLNISPNINPYQICQSGSGITISLWFKGSPSSGTWCRIFDFGDNNEGNTPSNHFLIAKYGSSNQLLFFVNWTGYYLTSETYFDNNWHHIVWSISKTNAWTIYIDNVLKFNNTVYNSSWAIPNVNWQRKYIGRSCYQWDGWFIGNIDDFRIYDKVLSYREVAILYVNDDKTKQNTNLYTMTESANDYIVTSPYQQSSSYLFSTVLSANKMYEYNLYGYLYLQRGAYIFRAYLSQNENNQIPCTHELYILDESDTPRLVSYFTPSTSKSNHYDVYKLKKYLQIENGGFYKIIFKSFGYNNKNTMTSDVRINVEYLAKYINGYKLNTLLQTFNQIDDKYQKQVYPFTTTFNSWFNNNTVANSSNESDMLNYARFLYYGFDNTTTIQNVFKNVYNTIPSLTDLAGIKKYLHEDKDYFRITDADKKKSDAAKEKKELEADKTQEMTSNSIITNVNDVIKQINTLDYKAILGNIENPTLKSNVNIYSVFDTSFSTINESNLTIERFANSQLTADGSIPSTAERALYVEAFV
jgi:hypothetical protein